MKPVFVRGLCSCIMVLFALIVLSGCRSNLLRADADPDLGTRADLASPADLVSPAADARVEPPTLTSLTVSPGTLSPAFTPLGLAYAANVRLFAETIVLTATTAEGNTITIDGIPVLSGVGSSPLPLALGANAVTIAVSGPGGATTYTIVVTRGGLVDQLTNPGIEEMFGSAVALSGDTLAIGAPHEQDGFAGGTDSGAVLVFTRTGTAWKQQAHLKASNPGATDSFGVSVALVGDTLVVGAPGESTGSGGAETAIGAAYVFTRVGDTWAQSAFVKADQPVEENFGIAVALSGETLAVGTVTGTAYVFAREGTNWSQQARVQGGQQGERFGMAVALSGDTLVVGARDYRGPNDKNQMGAAYVFARVGSQWTEEVVLRASDATSQDQFGSSLALQADTLVVGASGRGSSFTSAGGFVPGNGAAYVFTREGSGWSEQARLEAANGTSGDKFGATVALSKDAVAVGAIYQSGGGSGINPPALDPVAQSGAVYLFARSGAVWTQTAELKATDVQADGFFGSALALENDTLVVGALGQSMMAGAVYVY